MIIRHFKLWASVLTLLLVILVIFSGVKLFVGSCAYRNNCEEGGRAQAAHTPLPTLIPATIQPDSTVISVPSNAITCTVTTETLLSAWVSADFPQSQLFQFTDQNNDACAASYRDVQIIFSQSNLWYQGALECTACHNIELSAASSAGLDLSSYAGVTAGSGRTSAQAVGKDILGAGNWQDSTLNQVLFIEHQMPYGAPENAVLDGGPSILAGLPESVINATPTMTTTEVEIARPSNPGGPGEAINLTGDVSSGEKIFVANCQMCHGPQGTDNVLNPGSDDGTVPALNPIDETIANSDYVTFAYNSDLFIENGSRPAGINPARSMPPWGARNAITQQEIADVIAYIISLNK
jgi:mono/diheme cytochrome c family protein